MDYYKLNTTFLVSFIGYLLIGNKTTKMNTCEATKYMKVNLKTNLCKIGMKSK